MSNCYTQKEFEFEEDYPISGECEDCGQTTDDETAMDNCKCPDCGGNLIIETSHEGRTCHLCGFTFDMDESTYCHKNDNDIHICDGCYEDLPEE